MDQDITFRYNYCAKVNKEVQEIRKKYLPREESKLEKLKRLDHTVQTAGMIESLCAGIGGASLFGFGLCLAMQVIGSGAWLVAIGMLLGFIGIAGMTLAYPIYRAVFGRTKARYAPRILELAEELSAEN